MYQKLINGKIEVVDDEEPRINKTLKPIRLGPTESEVRSHRIKMMLFREDEETKRTKGKKKFKTKRMVKNGKR